MILFVHGFGSCGWGEKSLRLRRYFGVERLLAPDLPFHPQQVLERLHRLVNDYPVRAVVGSSLGGFYATCLNAERRLPSVLINPAVYPHRLLEHFIGRHRRWCDDMPFDVDTGYLDSLRALQRDRVDAQEAYLVLLQTADEVLDYRDAATYYRGQQIVCEPGGSHRFEHIERHLPTIAHWFDRHGYRVS